MIMPLQVDLTKYQYEFKIYEVPQKGISYFF